MFDKYFEMMNPVTIGILIGVLVIAFVIWWMRRKPAPTAAVKGQAQVANKTCEVGNKVNGFKCKCGQAFFTMKEIRTHVLFESKKEKGKHGIAGRVEMILPMPTPDGAAPAKKASILGTGCHRCLAVRGDTLEITTIPEPIGELYMADTSMPESGGMYTVRELPDGTVVDYDPRAVPMKTDQTPEYAYSATHWEDVKAFWIAEKRWWQSVANWWVAAVLIIDFVGVLVFFGG